MKRDGSVSNVRISELMMTEALTRKPAEKAGPGDICAVAGITEIMIGETLADPENPVPLPLITVDEPAISMTIGTNTSPLVGRGATGKGADNKAVVKDRKVTARQVKDRLDRELIGNVSLRVLDTERPDAWEVQGRGELALAILVEQMRREGFELTIGKPQVVTKEVDGKTYEPVERMTIDVPEEHMGAVTQLMGVRKGRMDNMSNHGSGWVRMEFVVPSRGLIGFRTEFLTQTRGTGIAHSIHEGHEPWFGTLTTRNNGSLVADRSRCRHRVRDDQPPGTRRALHGAGHRGVRGHDRRENSAPTTWTSTSPRRRSSPTCGRPRPTRSRRSSRRASCRWSSPWSSAATTSAWRSPRRPCASAR
ncbi:hypothetical protein GCM10023238_37750 [Streptomyces heliomycini]